MHERVPSESYQAPREPWEDIRELGTTFPQASYTFTITHRSQPFTLTVSPKAGVIDVSTEAGDEAQTDLPEHVKKRIHQKVTVLDRELREMHARSTEEMQRQRGGDPDEE